MTEVADFEYSECLGQREIRSVQRRFKQRRMVVKMGGLDADLD